jgi:hypothetical protein
VSDTPLADALAGVDHAQGQPNNFGLGPIHELAALRDLAYAVRAYLPAHPEDGQHLRDGKQVPATEVCVEAFGVLTEDEFRHIIETLMGQPRARHKDWAEHYVFSPRDPVVAGQVCAYLEEHKIAYDRETLTRWTP